MFFQYETLKTKKELNVIVFNIFKYSYFVILEIFSNFTNPFKDLNNILCLYFFSGQTD